MRISDWSSDVCSSDLTFSPPVLMQPEPRPSRVMVPSAWGTAQSPGTAWRRPSMSRNVAALRSGRSEERRVGKSVSVRVDLGGRRIIKKKKTIEYYVNLYSYTHYTRQIYYISYK